MINMFGLELRIIAPRKRVEFTMTMYAIEKATKEPLFVQHQQYELLERMEFTTMTNDFKFCMLMRKRLRAALYRSRVVSAGS